MDKDDLIFLLGTIVVFLVGIIVFSATFTIPIKSGVLQYLSGGAIIVSSIFLVAQIWKYLKKKIEESKDEKSHQEFLAKTTTSIDYTFFHSKIVGKYFNSDIGRMDVLSQDGIELKFNTIIKAVDKYYRKGNSNFYAVQLYTLKLLNSEQEAFYRKRISQLGGKIAIAKDKSRYDIGNYDIHRIWIKIEYNAIKELFAIFNENEIREVRVIDEFNSNIFTNEDRIKALESNFDFSLSVNRSTNKCQIYLRRGIADSTTKCINEIFKLLVAKNSDETKSNNVKVKEIKSVLQPNRIFGQAKFFVVPDINGNFVTLHNVLKKIDLV